MKIFYKMGVIKTIREKLYEPEFSDLTVVEFSDLAQRCKTYNEFIEKMKGVYEKELNYFGIAICGAKKKVNKLTGSMALLRLHEREVYFQGNIDLTYV